MESRLGSIPASVFERTLHRQLHIPCEVPSAVDVKTRATTVIHWGEKKEKAVKRTALFLKLNFRNEKLPEDLYSFSESKVYARGWQYSRMCVLKRCWTD